MSILKIPCSALLAAALMMCAMPVQAQQRPETSNEQTVLELVEFRELPLTHAARLLSEQTGLNIVASVQAGKTMVSLYLRNVPALAAVETLTSAHDLWYRADEKSGIIRIYTVDEYQRELTSFRDEETRVFTLLYPNVFHVAAAVRDLFGDRVQFSPGSEGEEETEDLEQRFSRFDIMDGRSQGLGQSGGAGGGGRGGSQSSSSSSRSGQSRSGTTGSTLRRQQMQQLQAPQRIEDLTPEEIQGLEQAIQAGDEATMQDLLHRRRATIFVTVIKRHNQILVRTGDEKVMQQIADLIKQLDVPTPLVMLEVKVMSIDLTDGFTSSFDWQLTGGDAAGSGFVNLTGALSSGLLFNYVGNEFITRLHLLETENRVTTLATPVLLTANNEVSRVFIGEERPLTRDFDVNPTVTANGVTIPGAAIPVTEFRPVGNTLLITPNINADRTVTLHILQENSTINKDAATIFVPDSVGGVSKATIDVVQSRTVSGTFVAKDRLAIAIGGLIEESISNKEEKVPIMGDLPGIGILFKRQTKEKSRRELVVMIRPYILNTARDAERISKELLDELSLHPNAPEGKGTLKTFESKDVLRPDSRDKSLLKKLNFHSVGDGDKE